MRTLYHDVSHARGVGDPRDGVLADADAVDLGEVSGDLSPVVRPLAYSDTTTVSTSDSRRCRLRTMTGSKVPYRSRGTSISTRPTASVTTVWCACHCENWSRCGPRPRA